VETLREDHGLEDASPLCYLTGLSSDLNVYCEPPAYLSEEDRRAFEPVAFYGSLPADRGPGGTAGENGASPFGPGGADLKVYVSFGTVAWRYWTPEALDALSAITAALGRMADVRAVISLGGAPVGPETLAELRRPNVRVETWVDQWSVLAAADVCITHNGLNSTHEAIFHRVAMISYPFFGDQPELARRCQDLGLAIPLAETPRAAITESVVASALARFRAERDSLRARAEEARRWELDTIAQRAAVIRRMVDLAGVTA
jgi:hypothetical protein